MIHVIIKEERRAEPRNTSIAMLDQLHDMGASVKDLNDPQILYAAEWDGVSPTVTVLKGSLSDIKMAYAGWPMESA